jgi:hypothetical protein
LSKELITGKGKYFPFLSASSVVKSTHIQKELFGFLIYTGYIHIPLVGKLQHTRSLLLSDSAKYALREMIVLAGRKAVTGGTIGPMPAFL